MYSIDYSFSGTPTSCRHNSCTCTCGRDREGSGSQKAMLDIGKIIGPMRPKSFKSKPKYLKNFKTDLTKSTIVAAALQRSRPRTNDDDVPPERIDLSLENDVTFDLGNMIAKFLSPQKTVDEFIVNTFKNFKIDFQNDTQGTNKAYITGLPDFFYEKTTGKIPEMFEIPVYTVFFDDHKRYHFKLPGSHLKKKRFDKIDLSEQFRGDSFQLNTRISLEPKKGSFEIHFRLSKLYRSEGETIADYDNRVGITFRINDPVYAEFAKDLYSDDDDSDVMDFEFSNFDDPSSNVIDFEFSDFDDPVHSDDDDSDIINSPPMSDFDDSDDGDSDIINSPPMYLANPEAYFEVFMIVSGFDDLFNE